MSWSALRYQPNAVRAFRTARRAARERRSQNEPARRKLKTEDLTKIFGLGDLNHIIAVLQRLNRMKGRVRGLSENRPFPQGRFPERNRHHLTPQCRKGEAYYGGGIRNLLLIRISRHDAWHKAFGVMTLEEVIIFLVRCREVTAGIWIAATISATFADRRRKAANHYVRRFRSKAA